MTDSEILKYSKQCQPASHTVKPRKFKLRFLKYSLIRINKGHNGCREKGLIMSYFKHYLLCA